MGIEVDKRELELESGITYLIKEARPYLSTKLFQSLVRSGLPGLTVSRIYPPKLEENYEIEMKNLQYIWLSRSRGENNMDPVRVGPLAMRIEEFIKEHPSSVIFLEGIEYLMLVNGFDVVRSFVDYIDERVVSSGATLLISVSPNAFDKREMALMERNKKVIDMPLITFTEGTDLLDILER